MSSPPQAPAPMIMAAPQPIIISSRPPPNPAHMADRRSDKLRCMCNACCCCYDACDFNNPILCCKGAGDCLCFRESCCIAVNTPHKGCGCTGDKNRGEFCKLGLFCYDCALVMPTKLCACANQCLCCYSVASLPCSPEYVPNFVCTICCPGLMISPRCGCCVAPPPCPALDKVLRNAPMMVVMDRGNPPPGSVVMTTSAPPMSMPVMAPATTVPLTASAPPALPPSRSAPDDGETAPKSPKSPEGKKKKKKAKTSSSEANPDTDGEAKKSKKKKKKSSGNQESGEEGKPEQMKKKKKKSTRKLDNETDNGDDE
eukprot:Nitzschia sp. Nitz4//scaffold64_size103689//85163//86314//NITZ4_004447-RA/size103689-snap-gene-0.121-mRNA-1//1//CDS//3329556163//5791//frame0